MTNTREGAGWFRRMFSSDYQELPQHGGDIKDKPDTSTQIMPRRFLRLSTRGFLLVLAAILLVPFLLALAAIEGRQYLSDGTADVFDMSGMSGAQEPASQASPQGVPQGVPKGVPKGVSQELTGIPVTANPGAILEEQSIFNRRLVILLPANAPGVNLCKALVTAVALGYPAPVIINWGKSGSHLAKIAGVLDYLDWASRLGSTNKDRLGEDDLIMVADSADSWFQLPPAVLLQRYHALNREADERLRKQWTGSGEMPMKQTIMVSAQKRCWPRPKSGSELHCAALPESPLREDLYGPETDKDPEMRQVDVRPKYINSGAFIGPVGDMRRYFRRAQALYEAGKGIQGDHFYSDQGFFGEIWGEQEMWRTWRRELGDKIDQSQNASLMVQDAFEYHVGLDYYQTISIPTVFEEDDGDILTLNNHTLIAERSKELEISPPRLRVPDDLVNATNPLSRVVGAEAGSLDWGDMTLYADFFTTAVPVNVHHNAHINNLKGRRIWWWDRMWFFPYLRQLVQAQLSQRRQAPLGRVNIPEGRAVYWGLEAYKKIRKFMPQRKILEEASWDSVCHSRWAKKNKQDWWDIVFRDEKGPLVV